MKRTAVGFWFSKNEPTKDQLREFEGEYFFYTIDPDSVPVGVELAKKEDDMDTDDLAREIILTAVRDRDNVVLCGVFSEPLLEALTREEGLFSYREPHLSFIYRHDSECGFYFTLKIMLRLFDEKVSHWNRRSGAWANCGAGECGDCDD